MSTVEEIKNAIEAYVASLAPTYQKSQYIWDSSLNSDSKTKAYYAVRPGASSFVNGTCRTITLDQDFTLEIGDNYRNKKDDDWDADGKIYDIYQIHETIYKAVMMDNFGIPRVLVVSDFSLNDPQVDKENKSVKIEATFTVKYRME
jgi:hypothetical protein